MFEYKKVVASTMSEKEMNDFALQGYKFHTLSGNVYWFEKTTTSTFHPTLSLPVKDFQVEINLPEGAKLQNVSRGTNKKSGRPSKK